MATVRGVLTLGRAILSYYPNSKLDLTNELDRALWLRLLGNTEDEILLRAVAAYARDGHVYEPNAGNICDYCGKVSLQRGETETLGLGYAYTVKVLERIRRCGELPR